MADDFCAEFFVLSTVAQALEGNSELHAPNRYCSPFLAHTEPIELEKLMHFTVASNQKKGEKEKWKMKTRKMLNRSWNEKSSNISSKVVQFKVSYRMVQPEVSKVLIIRGKYSVVVLR